MSKYKSLFLSDTGEHLDALEGDLVHLEQKPGDTERINEVFRHLHSIKGMASSMGYHEMAHLAHRLEDLMAYHREERVAVSSEEVDVLLRGLDQFRKQLQAADEDRPLQKAPADLLMSIETLTKIPEPKTPKQASVQVSHEGAVAYIIEAAISAKCEAVSVRAFLLYKRLSELGTVTESVPSVDDMRAGRVEGRVIRINLATERALAEIRKLVGTFAELEYVEIKQADLQSEPSTEVADKPSPVPEATPAEPEPVGTRISPATIRVRTDLLDFFVDSVGELVTLRSHFEELSDRIEAPALREGVRLLNQVVRKLHDRVMEVRMVSVSLLTQRLPRVCRDIARSRGKQVDLQIEGEDVELDRALVEALDTPILHLLRNAVDHGIEAPDERIAAGKPSQGTIRMEVKRDSNRVLMTLDDDGQGIDPQQVLHKALEMGLVSTEKVFEHPQRIIDLIFHPGFSTRAGVTDVSGRGVGLDAVRNVIGNLGGRVTVKSEPGRGTSFTLDMPLTLAILQVLLVEAGEHLLAFPASRIIRAMSIRPGQVIHSNGKKAVKLSGESIPIVSLLELLGERNHVIQESVLVRDRDQQLMALGVKHITGHREVVLKSVGSFFRQIGPFNGSAVLGDGRPLLILDVDQLIRRARSPEAVVEASRS